MDHHYIGGLFGLIILACVGVYAIISQLPPPEIILPDTPVDYELPLEAEIIEEQASVPDFFGDFSYAASFRLADSEIDEVLKKGFEWFPPIKSGHYVSEATWETGVLPENVLGLIENLDVRLNNGPNDSATYTYLYEWVDGGWWRLVAIDEGENIIYYYESSW